jgi:hypothetical protein
MNTPERSTLLAEALRSEPVDLPQDFAGKVAELAEAGGVAPRPLRWTDVGLCGAFSAMMGICVAGWIVFGEQSSDGTEWLDSIVSALIPHPWLVTGLAGVAIVQVLTFRRRIH